MEIIKSLILDALNCKPEYLFETSNDLKFNILNKEDNIIVRVLVAGIEEKDIKITIMPDLKGLIIDVNRSDLIENEYYNFAIHCFDIIKEGEIKIIWINTLIDIINAELINGILIINLKKIYKEDK